MYNILLLPLIAGILAQILKFFIASNKQKFSAKNLLAYSGMPSGHTAMVISLAVIIGLEDGWHSPVFSLAVVFAIIVIRDALGIRQYLGQHGKALNILVKDLKEDLDEKYPHQLERIGHTPMQVLAGGILGFAISVFGYFIF
jgi:acid phosphatase family membrane protein YuiD